jgi:hypothetical protein
VAASAAGVAPGRSASGPEPSAPDAPPRVVIRDEGQSITVCVFASNGAWLAEVAVDPRRARQLAVDLQVAATRHEDAARTHRGRS